MRAAQRDKHVNVLRAAVAFSPYRSLVQIESPEQAAGTMADQHEAICVEFAAGPGDGFAYFLQHVGTVLGSAQFEPMPWRQRHAYCGQAADSLDVACHAQVRGPEGVVAANEYYCLSHRSGNLVQREPCAGGDFRRFIAWICFCAGTCGVFRWHRSMVGRLGPGAG